MSKRSMVFVVVEACVEDGLAEIEVVVSLTPLSLKSAPNMVILL